MEKKIIIDRRGYIPPKVNPDVLKEYQKKYERAFVIDGMDMIQWVPTFRCISYRKNEKSRNIIYNFSSDSQKTLFITPLYYALYNFISFLGYDPESPFLYAYTKEDTIKTEYYENRLKKYSKIYKYDGKVREFYFVNANFLSNDIGKDFGFRFVAGSRNVTLIARYYAKFEDNDGNSIPPEFFFYLFLLNIKYPYYVYDCSKQFRWLGKLKKSYDDLINKKGIYMDWGF